MAIKSLLSQARQIKSSEKYKDINYINGLQGPRELSGNMHTALVAEGTSFLEDDINNLRAQFKEIIGKTTWYDKASISLESLVAIGTKLIIQPIQVGGLTFAAGSTNLTISSGKAGSVSTSTVGYVFDSAALPSVDSKARVTLRNAVTNMPIVDSQERVIYGILTFDGVDGGTVTGTTGGQLKIKMYTDNNGVAVASTYAGAAEAILPQRIELHNASENFSMLNAGFAGSVGATELGDRIWVELDSVDGTYKVTSGNNVELGIVTNDDLTKVINKIIGEAQKARDTANVLKTFSGLTIKENSDWTLGTNLNTEWDGSGINTYYLKNNSGAGTTTMMGAFKVLDNKLKVVEGLALTTDVNHQVKILTSNLAENTQLVLPNLSTVKINDKNAIDVYVNGQRLVSDFQVSGVADGISGDYSVASTTSIFFNFPLIAGDVISMTIYKV